MRYIKYTFQYHDKKGRNLPSTDLYKRFDSLRSRTLCYRYSGMIHECSRMRRSHSFQEEAGIHLCL